MTCGTPLVTRDETPESGDPARQSLSILPAHPRMHRSPSIEIRNRVISARTSFEGYLDRITNPAFKRRWIGGSLIWLWMQTVENSASAINVMYQDDTFAIRRMS